MYTKANKWDLAQKVAKDNLPEPEIQQLYIKSVNNKLYIVVVRLKNLSNNRC